MDFVNFIRGSFDGNTVDLFPSYKVSRMTFDVTPESGLIVFSLHDVNNSLVEYFKNLGWKVLKKVNSGVIDLQFFPLSDRDAVRFLSDLYRNLDSI